MYNAPCIVTDYPKDIKAFYMKLNPDGKTVAAMDILVPKIGKNKIRSDPVADASENTILVITLPMGNLSSCVMVALELYTLTYIFI